MGKRKGWAKPRERAPKVEKPKATVEAVADAGASRRRKLYAKMAGKNKGDDDG